MKKTKLCALLLCFMLLTALLPIPTLAAPGEVYTITFDSNGGSGAMASQTATEGTGFVMPYSTFTPPEHYIFAGWYIDVGDTYHTFVSEDKCGNNGAPVYLYRNATAKAAWIADGGYWGAVSRSVAVYNSLTNLSSSNELKLYSTPADATPQRPGVGTSAYEAVLTPTQGYTLPSAITVELVEMYDSNNASGGNYYAPAKALQVFSAGTDYNYNSSNGEIVISNATLQNINIDYNGVPVRYHIRITAAGVAYNNPPATTYTITYDPNGGGRADPNDMPQDTVTDGVPFELPNCTFRAPSMGSVFKAWAIGSPTGTQIEAGESFTFTESTTVYAVWEETHPPHTTCIITYDANGGSGTMPPGSATAGVPFKLSACTFTAPAGKQFKAWAISSKNGAQVDAGEEFTFTEATTLYAIWTDRPLGDVPKTGDFGNITLWIAALFVSLIIISASLVHNKKKKPAA